MSLPALVRRAARALDAAPSDATIDALVGFVELVRLWNARSNLTGARHDEALVDVLLADAFVLADRGVVPQGARVVDVGAGAGAPTLPLALIRPDLRVTLLEPRRLRVAFLRTVIGHFDGLVARARVEEGRLAPDEVPADAPFDLALSRATFEPAAWLARGRALAGRVVVLVGQDPLPEADDRLAERRYALPFAGTARALAVYGAKTSSR
ncbi:MAG TPA: RsmG family class I SAM-dependent methyltransferase [Sandaracinaceae bacterium LLY-WYZ-13_1]|nr:RsmG family class I SAM-dependent methyltransferase [Sandaracinaceae bacterium LLY-WYZ-13_1]